MAEYKYNIPASGWVDKQIAKYKKAKCNVTDFSYEAVEGKLWDDILIRTDESDTTYGYILLSVRENENESSGRSQDVKVTFKVNGDECSTKLSLCQVNKHEDTPEPPTPVLVMLKLVETGGTTHTAECQTEKVDITNETITAITTDKASIKSVEINGSCVNEISFGAFSGCTKLTSVTMTEGVATVGGFGSQKEDEESQNTACSGLTSINIPNGTTTIGSAAFRWCSGLTSVTIPSTVTKINSHALYGCISLTSVTIPDSVTNLGEYAFRYVRFTNLVIPSSITSIGKGCFSDCLTLQSVTLPSNITSLPNYMFNRCGSLTSVTIPASVTYIGDFAFEDCTGLTSITCLAIDPPRLGNTSSIYDCSIYVPAASVDTYKAAEVWSTYANKIYAIP